MSKRASRTADGCARSQVVAGYLSKMLRILRLKVVIQLVLSRIASSSAAWVVVGFMASYLSCRLLTP